MVAEVRGLRPLNVLTKLHENPSPMLRLVIGGLLVVLAFAGGMAVSASKTVTLTVDGTTMRVTTMKSRVIEDVYKRQRRVYGLA